MSGILYRSWPRVLNGALIYWAQFAYAEKRAEEKDPNTQRERDRGRDRGRHRGREDKGGALFASMRLEMRSK